MPCKDPEKAKKYYKEYYKKHKEQSRLKSKRWSQANREKVQKYQKEYRRKNLERLSEHNRKYWKYYSQKIRREVLSHYSGDPPSCSCCGENHLEFLTIDHIYGGGNKQKKKIGKVGWAFPKWLKDNNYPDGYRVLCYNCNCSRGFYGYCPHERKLR